MEGVSHRGMAPPWALLLAATCITSAAAFNHPTPTPTRRPTTVDPGADAKLVVGATLASVIAMFFTYLLCQYRKTIMGGEQGATITHV